MPATGEGAGRCTGGGRIPRADVSQLPACRSAGEIAASGSETPAYPLRGIARRAEDPPKSVRYRRKSRFVAFRATIFVTWKWIVDRGSWIGRSSIVDRGTPPCGPFLLRGYSFPFLLVARASPYPEGGKKRKNRGTRVRNAASPGEKRDKGESRYGSGNEADGGRGNGG